MMAVILAGGKGTRLKPFTMTIPKPLLPLGDLPILEVVLKQLAAAGFKRIVVTLGHMPHLFIAAIGDGSRFGVAIEYLTEDEPLGTAGPLRLIKNPEPEMLVMNGDILTTLDFGSFIAQHRASKASATIALHKRSVHIDYGVVETTGSGTLSRYVEKPVIDYKVSMGINALSRGALAMIAPRGKFDMPQLMQALADNGKQVSCFETDCYWQDIGRFDDYTQASADFASDSKRFLPQR